MQAQQDKWWLAEVEAAVAKLIRDGADAKRQQEMWDWIADEFEDEAAAYAVRLFAEERWQAEQKDEPEQEPKAAGQANVGFGSLQAKPNDQPALLSKSSPFDSAKEFVARFCIMEGVYTTYYWGGHFWTWNGCYYGKVSDETVNKWVWTFLDASKTGVASDSNRFRPKPHDVGDVVKALKGGLLLNVDPPCWLDGRAGADRVMVFRNGLVDVETGVFMGLSPKLWVHHAVDYEYNPEAGCPMWERWLGEVFEGDAESQECIEEQLGYGMTKDVRFHKGFLWIGQKGREGKGTLASVLKQLVGEGEHVSLSFHDWHKTENSGEVMIGKKVGVFPDVRFKEGKWFGLNYDPGGLDHVSREWTLKINGGDNITQRGKYKTVPWQGVLPIKLYLISNNILNFNDTILASRFITVAFNVSFRGREDTEMSEKLKAELPGIANRCLRAYRRLRERGGFIQPASGLKLEKSIAASSNPFQAFFDDRCVFDVNGSVRIGVLYANFQSWCTVNGYFNVLRSVPYPQHLGRELRKQVRGLEKLKKFRPGDNQKREYVGIRLKNAVELEGEDDVGVEVKPVAEAKVVQIRRGFLRRF
jgi:putative DNA primase/helicase